MKFTVPVKNLKKMGYRFQKLYAANHKTYRKEVSGYTIWLWEVGKELEVEDWHQNTGNVIEFYKEHRHEIQKKSSVLSSSTIEYMEVQLHTPTGKVQYKDTEEYYKVFKVHHWNDWNKKYPSNEWRNIILHKESMDKVIKELKLLTDKI